MKARFTSAPKIGVSLFIFAREFQFFSNLLSSLKMASISSESGSSIIANCNNFPIWKTDFVVAVSCMRSCSSLNIYQSSQDLGIQNCLQQRTTFASYNSISLLIQLLIFDVSIHLISFGIHQVSVIYKRRPQSNIASRFEF